MINWTSKWSGGLSICHRHLSPRPKSQSPHFRTRPICITDALARSLAHSEKHKPYNFRKIFVPSITQFNLQFHMLNPIKPLHLDSKP